MQEPGTFSSLLLLASVLDWKFSSLLSMEFFPCKKNPCSALPALLSLLPLLPVLWLGASRGNCRGLCRMNGDSSHSEQEQSIPGSIPVLPCCEPDLSLLLHPLTRDGGFGSLGMAPGPSCSHIRAAAAALQGAQQSLAAVPLPWSCPFSPSLPALAAPLPLLRAWMDSWLSPFQLEQPESLTWCKKSWCHLAMGLSSGSPLPCKPQGAAGKGRDG